MKAENFSVVIILGLVQAYDILHDYENLRTQGYKSDDMTADQIKMLSKNIPSNVTY